MTARGPSGPDILLFPVSDLVRKADPGAAANLKIPQQSAAWLLASIPRGSTMTEAPSFGVEMAARDPELARLQYAEHLAYWRTELMRGHPPDDQLPAIAQLVKARELARKHRAENAKISN